MNRLKFFIAAFAITVSVLVIYSCAKDANANFLNQNIENRNSVDLLDLIGVDCFHDLQGHIPGCNDKKYNDTLVLTNLPGYPGCSFTVVYSYFICGGTGSLFGLTDISMSDFQILEHDCQQFSDEIENSYNSSIWSDFIHEFDAKIHDAIKSHLVNEFLNPQIHKCGFGQYINIKFFSSSCYKYCTAWREGYYISTKIACGMQCCKTETRLCIQADGTLKKQVTIAPIDPPFCQEESLLGNGDYVCSGKNAWMSNCTFDRDKCIP